MNLASNYFIERAKRTEFYPWYSLMLLGAVWVVEVPEAADRRLLVRLVTSFHLASLAVPLLGVLAAYVFGSAPKTLFLTGWLIVFACYSLVMGLLTHEFPRVPFREGVAHLSRQVGTKRLWQFVALGIYFLGAALLFRVYALYAIFVIGGLTANSLIAIYTLTLGDLPSSDSSEDLPR